MKAQVEVVGLLIIVMMISFIMLFALSTYLKKPDEVISTFKEETLASSLMSAILRTTTDCNSNEPDMKDLLIDCAKWKDSYYSNINCGTLNSCEFFEEKTELILEETLEKWNKPYELRVIPPQGEFGNIHTLLIHIKGYNESNEYSSVSTATQPLPVGTNYGSLNMMLCIGGECPDI